MAEPWIRVHSGLANKPIIGRAAVALNVSWHEAMGLLVQFWGNVAQYKRDGDMSNVPDFGIETWAGWNQRGRDRLGKREGRFAAFIREHHLDADGYIREWRRYAGHLEERGERDDSPDGKSTYVYYAVAGDQCKIGWSGNPWSRVNEMRTARPGIRLAAAERGSRDAEEARHDQFAHLRIEREWFQLDDELLAHIETVAATNTTIRTTKPATNGTTESTTKAPTVARGQARTRAPAQAHARPDEDETLREKASSITQSARDAESALAGTLATDADRQALASIVRNARSAEACIASIAGVRDGLGVSHAPSIEQLGDTLRDFAANGEPWNAALFRGYLTRAMAPRKRVSAAANGEAPSGDHATDVLTRMLEEERAKEAANA